MVSALIVALALVGVVLSLLLARRDRARREGAKLSDEDLARRTREMQRKWHRGCSEGERRSCGEEARAGMLPGGARASRWRRMRA